MGLARERTAALVVTGGLVAGMLDLAYACAFWALKGGVPARRILQSVAAGLLGPASFAGGRASAALGFVLHFGIALGMAAVYWRAALRWPVLGLRPVPCGAAYGLLLYVVMNAVVVPLSAAPRASRDRLWVALGIVVHVFLVGLPIAVCVARAVTSRPSRDEG